jgi:hypothetical protein
VDDRWVGVAVDRIWPMEGLSAERRGAGVIVADPVTDTPYGVVGIGHNRA